MVRSEFGPTGSGMIAALDAVAKLKANAAPITNVLIINCPFDLQDSPALRRFEKPTGAKLASDITKTMTVRLAKRFFI
jgi:hypothetical protein